MKRLQGAEGAITKLVAGERHRFTYHWIGLRGEAQRNHTIHVRSLRCVPTGAFGEQEVYEVVDTSSSPFYDLWREVLYSPALKMFVSFKVKDSHSNFKQRCELASLKSP